MLKYSDAIRNGQLDQITSVTGASARLHIYSGAAPADCASPATGAKLVEMALPATWMSAASSGAKSMAGGWGGSGEAGAGAGTSAGYFRVYNNGNATCHMQGTVTGAGGGGDMELDNVSIASGQSVTVTTFTITAGNA